MHWRNLIENYLKACALDDLARQTAALEANRGQFLQQHASETFIAYETQRIQDNIERLSKSPSDPNSFDIVDENNNFMIVYVPSGENGLPHHATRFLLTKPNGNWLIDDYYWECSCDDGNCNWCSGSGICAVCGGNGECKFCDNDLTCQLCKGSKQCGRCGGTDMPGWTSMGPKPKNAR